MVANSLTMKTLVALVIATLLLATGSALAEQGEVGVVRSSSGDRVLTRPQRLESSLFQLNLERAAKNANGEPFDLYYSMGVGDLDADGTNDVLTHHWSIAAADQGAGYSGTLRLTAFSATSGHRLWTSARDVQNTLPVPSRPIDFGGGLGNGILLTTDSHFPTYTLTIFAIDQHGQIVWDENIVSTYNYGMPLASANLPVSVHLVDALREDATDVLLAVLDYADGASQLRVRIIDGSSGIVEERDAELGMLAFPSVAPIGDLDGDGKDDYIIVGYRPDERGHVTAYSGRSGELIWTQTEIDLNTPFLSAEEIGSLNGDAIPEVAVPIRSENASDKFQVLNGRNGKSMWTAIGMFPIRLGDLNSDKEEDLGTASVWQKGDSKGEEFRGYLSNGQQRYKRRYIANTEVCKTQNCDVLSYLLDAGDLDDDGVEDLYVQRYVGPNARQQKYLVEGRTGRLLPYDKRAIPVLESLDGSGDDLLRIVVTKGAYEVIAMDGRRIAKLWDFAARGEVVGALEPYGNATHADPDRLADIFLTVKRKGRVSVVMIDGRKGTKLWSSSVPTR